MVFCEQIYFHMVSADILTMSFEAFSKTFGIHTVLLQFLEISSMFYFASYEELLNLT